MTTTDDRILGSLLAAACGDALGAPTEFENKARAPKDRVRDLIGGGVFGWKPGETTDDTATLHATAQAYTEGRRYQPQRAAKALRDWLRSNPPDVGNQTRGALLHLDTDGAGWLVSGELYQKQRPHAAGNGSLMRIAPVGLARTRLLDILREAKELGAITHAHPLCINACRVFAVILSSLVDGDDVREAVGRGLGEAVGEVTDVLQYALNGHAPKFPSVTGPAQGYVLLTFEVAVRALLRAKRPEHLERELIRIANAGGDTDTNATCAGALLGARFGVGAVPVRWTEALLPCGLGKLSVALRYFRTHT